jgi:hypothetical protein
MTHSIALSDRLYRQLEQRAKLHHRSVDEWVEETVKREMPPIVAIEPELPP